MAARSCTTQRQRPNIDPQIPILNVRAGHEAIARIRCKANAACLTLRPPSPPHGPPADRHHRLADARSWRNPSHLYGGDRRRDARRAIGPLTIAPERRYGFGIASVSRRFCIGGVSVGRGG